VSGDIPGVATNLKLDDALIEKAVELGEFKTKQQAVNSALREFVERRQRLRILELKGQIDFHPDWDYKKIRRGRF
jgi:Arc/MetJ family transcription regulator